MATEEQVLSHARICIIGGGAMGVGLLYHLTKVEGWRDIILLEKGELTSGSTWHAAGQCPNFIGNLSMAMVHHYGTYFYPALEKEVGAPIGWHGCGGIRLAISDEEVSWFHYVAGISKLVGYEMELIGPSEIKKIHPFIKVDDVKLGAYTLHDGHVDPASVTNAMAQVAKKYGADIRRRTTVTAISQDKNGEWRITTDKGVVVAEHVVNAAGCYGDHIMRMVGKRAPMSNMMHQYIVTETVKEIVAHQKETGKELPVIRDPYSHGYLRQERDGILVGPYERQEAKICFPDNQGIPPNEFENALFEPEMDRLYPWLERAGERFPLFAEYGIKKVISGPITHTPDGNVLMGPAAGLKNFWMATGASIGIAQGAGNGKYLAQWMVRGQSEINMRPFDPRRFGDWALGKYTDEKSIDDYQHMYHCHCPGEYHDAGRPITDTPLTKFEKDKGAVFSEIHGWERAKWFDADHPGKGKENYSFRYNNAKPMVDAECAAVMNGVGVVNMSSFSKFLVEGDEAMAILDHLTTNKLPRKDGAIVLTHALTPGGVYNSEFTMWRRNDKSFMLMSGASDRVRDTDLLQMAVKGRKATFRDASMDYTVLVVAGPKARAVLQPLTQTDLASSPFPWLSGQEITLAGLQVMALRVNYVGELGWEIYHKPSDMLKLYDAIMSSAKSVGAGARDVGTYAVNSLRLEKGYRGLGSELTNELGPIEAKMERFVDFNKDFVGKEAVLKVKNGTPRYKLVMLKLADADHDMLGNEPIFVGDQRVGVTTGGAYGRRLKTALSFAYVKPAYDKIGAIFTVPSLGRDRMAEVIADCPYDAKNEKLRA